MNRKEIRLTAVLFAILCLLPRYAGRFDEILFSVVNTIQVEREQIPHQLV